MATQSDNRCNLPVEMERSSISTPGVVALPHFTTAKPSQAPRKEPELSTVFILATPSSFLSLNAVYDLRGLLGRGWKSRLSAMLQFNVH